MQTLDFDFFDSQRNRKIPVCVYLPEGNLKDFSTIIFNPGFQGQEEFIQPEIKSAHKNQTYLAKYFVNIGYAFITIQHDILGDKDGLEMIDPKAIQHEARKHLYMRGSDNILFVLDELKKQNLSLRLDQFIIGGHSNGGDIAKYFTNLYPEKVSSLILFDARRCRLEPALPIRLLMFEANDTSTDVGVLPEPKNSEDAKRPNLEWVIIKPLDALHESYMDDYITDNIREQIFKTLDWFLADSKPSNQ